MTIQLKTYARRAALILALGVAGLALSPSVPVEAQVGFDGRWTVLVVTQAGDCDKAYQYAVQIASGAVSYAGEASINLSGRVDGSGRVNVSISRGGQSANGAGRLSGSRGTGTWKGQSRNTECSGRWEATRR